MPTQDRTLISYTSTDGRFHVVCTPAWFWSLDLLTGAVVSLPLLKAEEALKSEKLRRDSK